VKQALPIWVTSVSDRLDHTVMLDAMESVTNHRTDGGSVRRESHSGRSQRATGTPVPELRGAARATAG
jgi:hypothetical protein